MLRNEDEVADRVAPTDGHNPIYTFTELDSAVHRLAGATATTVNPTYGVGEVGFQLDDAGASLPIMVPMFVDTAIAAAETIDSKGRLHTGDIVVDEYGHVSIIDSIPKSASGKIL